MKNQILKRASLFTAGAFLCLPLLLGEIAVAQESKPATPATPPTTAKPATPAASPQAATATTTPNPFANIPPAKPEDVSSIDAIVKALYSVISGDAGQKRDWNRFRSLFYPNAKMIPTGKNPQTGKAGGRFLTPEDYVERAGPMLEKDGFHEIGIAQRVEQFGNIAHVFTTYETKHKATDEKPFMRGINSIQLINDGSRWWVLSITWSQETPDSPIPEKYLKTAQ
jgi:hypothetical protein